MEIQILKNLVIGGCNSVKVNPVCHEGTMSNRYKIPLIVVLSLGPRK